MTRLHTLPVFIVSLFLLATKLSSHNVSAECPSFCNCYANVSSVLCDNASLTTVPDNIPDWVRHMSLRSNNITFLENGTLDKFPILYSLDLSDNQLADIAEDAFVNTNLSRLHLVRCGLTNTGLRSLTQLEQLHHLSLSGNNLTNFNPSDFNFSATLKTLDLSHNELTAFPDIMALPYLTRLELQGNMITHIAWSNWSTTAHPLRYMDVSDNEMRTIAADSLSILSSLEHLDVRHNSLVNMDAKVFRSLEQLLELRLDHNPLSHIPNMAFSNCTKLKHLQASAMPNLTNIPPLAFEGLVALETLNLSNNPSLKFIHPAAFAPLSDLKVLDLSNNHLEVLYQHTFLKLDSLESVYLAGNPWSCDCDFTWLHQWLVEANRSGVLREAGVMQCSYPHHLAGVALLTSSPSNFTCDGAHILNHTEVAWYQIGSQAMLDCVVGGTPRPVVTWITPRHVVLRHLKSLVDHSQVDPEEEAYHSYHHWHETQVYIHQPDYDHRITTLPNGSLYIDYVTRADAGPYTCFVENYLGNDTVVVNFKLKYLIKVTVVESIIVGFGSALTFFLVTVVIAAIRYVTFWCSKEERTKRKSIREVLDTIHDYKSAQFDKLKDYKQAKVEQITAYKSAKLGQLSAFKTARIDKIRTYKQMTVTNVIFHMQRMRDHYTVQVAKIKDNCTKQVEKLQENYCNQMGKFKDYKFYQVDRIRDNYQCQVMKIREYGSDQLKRLRDQYKTQQQHVMKLLELLDIGNCMHVIEAECVRTESMIFDPIIALDLEAKPVHLCLPTNNDESGNSDYLTASSEEGSEASMSYVLSLEDETVPRVPCTHTTTTDPLNAINDELPNVSARVPMLHTFAHLPNTSHFMFPSANKTKPAKHNRKHRKKLTKRSESCGSIDSVTASTSGQTREGRHRHVRNKSNNGKKPGKLSASTTTHSPLRPRHIVELSDDPLRKWTSAAGDLISSTDTEYESARESRDNTPEFSEGTLTPSVSIRTSPVYGPEANKNEPNAHAYTSIGICTCSGTCTCTSETTEV